MTSIFKKQRTIDEYNKILNRDIAYYLKLFEEHCQQGWSPQIFTARLPKVCFYEKLKKDCPEWKAIHDKYKKKPGDRIRHY